MLKYLLTVSAFLPLLLHARKVGEVDTPWFTGPLLTPSGHVVPPGHVNYEPYIYWTETNNKYDKNWHTQTVPRFTSFLSQFTVQAGILPATEFNFAPQVYWNHSEGASSWELGDLPFLFGFQILNNPPGSWWPAIKFRLSATLPLGKYQKLNPDKKGTDIGGLGSWLPGTGFVFTRLFHLSGVHYLSTRYFIGYIIPTPVHVKGLSAYGGTPLTRGTVYPGNATVSLLGLECTLTKNWALAFDFQYLHVNKVRFSGKSGGLAPKKPSSEQFSIAPALEYNWNDNLGIIGGAWFTVGGRNSSDFLSWVVAFNVYQ